MWDKNCKLKFSDFKGKRPLNSEFEGLTSVAITHSFKESALSIDCYFLQEESYLDSQSEELLKHEQLHFDLGGIIARIIENEFNYLRFEKQIKINDNNWLYYVDKIESNLLDYNFLYDSITNHGINKHNQLIWFEIINQAKDDDYMMLEEFNESINLYKGKFK
ncbi:hypothetical protein [Flammeovirga sp. SubArs3]|uniref:hypothetical protein n=1 Tax=Flammeovirga sp. SubArs3 TaxID=2995316 RepID=UPI00248BECC4|nr:hypothetical protein [Flammeovirga sp. SubArs3]